MDTDKYCPKCNVPLTIQPASSKILVIGPGILAAPVCMCRIGLTFSRPAHTSFNTTSMEDANLYLDSQVASEQRRTYFKE